MIKIGVLGPGPGFKGGMANYTLSLAKALANEPGVEVHLIGWTRQYPFFIPRDFKDRVSKPEALEPLGIRVHEVLDYNNPLTWQLTARLIKKLGLSRVVIQWSIALQGIPLGYLARRLVKSGVEVTFDLHFVRQKEATTLDEALSRYALSATDSFIVHARRTADELTALLPGRPLALIENDGPVPAGQRKGLLLFHPVYDLFKPVPEFDGRAFKEKMGLNGTVFLFFGFIRKYKGLHFCLEAFAELERQRPGESTLLVVGESFWRTLDEGKLSTRIKQAAFKLARRLTRGSKANAAPSEDESQYDPLSMIPALGIEGRVKVVNEFVANEAVYQYFQSSDALLLFYEYATPSGVESMAYNFHKPILATAVGHFPETIREGVTGLLARPADTGDMARVMARFLDDPITPEGVRALSSDWTWTTYARAILGRRAL